MADIHFKQGQQIICQLFNLELPVVFLFFNICLPWLWWYWFSGINQVAVKTLNLETIQRLQTYLTEKRKYKRYTKGLA